MLQSSLEKLIHSALVIFSNPDTQPWSILHAELLEDKVILRFFFWMLLVDYSKVDVYGNHKGFFPRDALHAEQTDSAIPKE